MGDGVALCVLQCVWVQQEMVTGSAAVCREPRSKGAPAPGCITPEYKLQRGSCSEEGAKYSSSLPLQQSIPEWVIDPSIKGSGSVSPGLPAHPPTP